MKRPGFFGQYTLAGLVVLALTEVGLGQGADFTLGFRFVDEAVTCGARRVGPAGSTVELDVYATVTSNLTDDIINNATIAGPKGFSLSIGMDNLELVPALQPLQDDPATELIDESEDPMNAKKLSGYMWDRTVAPTGMALTDAARIYSGGFESTLPTDPAFQPTSGPLAGMGAQGHGLVSGVIITLQGKQALPKTRGLNVSLLRFKVRGTIPATGETVARIRYKAGLVNIQGGTPGANVVTFRNMSVNAEQQECTITLAPEGGQVQCDEYGFYFGADTAMANYPIAGNSYAISMRNSKPVLGFSLGVKKDAANLTYAATLGKASDRLVELNITDNDGLAHGPPDASFKTNAATLGDPTQNVASIALGAGIGPDSTLNCGDDPPTGAFFFAIDCAPPVGGPGYTVAFAGDVTGQGTVIPATAPTGTPCPVNEILVVSFGVVAPRFSRGDCNGDGRINVTDGAVCAQNIFANRLVFFDCDDMLDADNNGQLNASDPLMILNWAFRNGPNLDPPFRSCGTEPPADTTKLGCTQANCQ